jgi:hypothetical protein
MDLLWLQLVCVGLQLGGGLVAIGLYLVATARFVVINSAELQLV